MAGERHPLPSAGGTCRASGSQLPGPRRCQHQDEWLKGHKPAAWVSSLAPGPSPPPGPPSKPHPFYLLSPSGRHWPRVPGKEDLPCAPSTRPKGLHANKARRGPGPAAGEETGQPRARSAGGMVSPALRKPPWTPAPIGAEESVRLPWGLCSAPSPGPMVVAPINRTRPFRGE